MQYPVVVKPRQESSSNGLTLAVDEPQAMPPPPTSRLTTGKPPSSRNTSMGERSAEVRVRAEDAEITVRRARHEAELRRAPTVGVGAIRWKPSGRQMWVAVTIWSGSSLARITTPG